MRRASESLVWFGVWVFGVWVLSRYCYESQSASCKAIHCMHMRCQARQLDRYSTERAPSKSFGITSIIQPPSYVVDQWVPINLHLEGVGLYM